MMSTTLNAHSENSLGHFVALVMCFLFASTGYAQAVESTASDLKKNSKEEIVSFTYTFRLKGVSDRASAKDFSESARGLLDCVPFFDDRTDSFTFQSAYSFEGVDINAKLADLGYSAEYFKQVEAGE